MVDRKTASAPARQAGTLLCVAALSAVLTVVATWPQAARLDSVPDNVDAYFSLWRIGWIAHQLPSRPGELFDTNIFHPEKGTLAYSDAVLLQGVVSLPFLNAGVPVVYVYNALVLGSFVACALAMFLLVQHLTGATLPAMLAGLVFAFTPYRFDHYFHLELLWAFWMPLAFWMAHRTLEHGRLRDGLLLGASVAMQILSSIYYGVFLCAALAVFFAAMIGRSPAAVRRRAVLALGAGALVVVSVAAPYMRPYMEVRGHVGDRKIGEALLHGAGPRHYLAAMPESRLYGELTGRLGRHEKRLFPGFVAILLAAWALWPPVSRTSVAYTLVLVAAANLSAGPRGLGYEWLVEHGVVFRGLRAPARAGQVVLLATAVLAAAGCVRLRAWLAARGIRADLVVAVVLAAAFAEYLVRPLRLTSVPTAAPPAYEWLRSQPPGVVAEFPMPTMHNAPLHEGQFQFLSTFHWRPLVNGYSGTWSTRQVRFLEAVKGFPDARAMDALRAAGVSYVLVHERFLQEGKYTRIVEALRRAPGLEQAGRFSHEGFEVAVYRLSRGR